MVRTTRRATGRGASLPPAWLAILAIAGLVLLLAVRQAPPRSLAQEAGPAEGIAADITGTYDIRPDEPAIGVKWQVDLENTGPSPWSEPGDPPTYLDSIEVFVQGDSSTFQASGPADERLSVSFLEFGSGYAYVTVQLGRTLEYGDKYSLTYSYRITSTDENRYSLRPSYVSIYAYSGIFPIDTYRSSTLFVTVPLTYSQHTLVGAGDCSRAYKGPVADVLHQLIGGVRSGMSYCGSRSLAELWKKAEFIRITNAGWDESKPHHLEK